MSDAQGLFFVGTIGTMLAAYLLVAKREILGDLVRHATLWSLIFLGVNAGLLWPRLQEQPLPKQTLFADDQRVETERAHDGHYYLTLALEGTTIDFLVDTGATNIVLTRDDAVRVGIDPGALDYSTFATTANGVARSAKFTMDEISIGSIRDQGLDIWVNEAEMQYSLLGMSYLSRFERFEISNGRLILER